LKWPSHGSLGVPNIQGNHQTGRNDEAFRSYTYLSFPRTGQG
jgi:hypothetical protein